MNSQSRPTTIIAAAVDYARRGWSVVPLKGDKRPAVLTWKQYQKHATKPEDASEWFGRVQGVEGVGIVLGAVSGGLAVRDFDDAGAYSHWAKAHPDLAETLPTAKTARGIHVYIRADGVTTHKYSDGELRGEGAYVCAPPSKHPSGACYSWVIPPEDDVPRVDPALGGLDRAWTAGGTAGIVPVETERTESTETPEHTERTEDTEDTEETEDPEAIAKGWCAETRSRIEDAISRTLPTAFGQRNAAVFRFARALKAVPAVGCLKARTLRALRPVVKAWYERGKASMLTRDFGRTWGDFAHAWEQVKFAEGDDVLGKALERAEAADAPAWAIDYAPAQMLLASLCRELQRGAGSAPFFLGARTAGVSVGVDKDTANRWLWAFVADGAIEVVVKGTRQSGKATRWRYIAKDL